MSINGFRKERKEFVRGSDDDLIKQVPRQLDDLIPIKTPPTLKRKI